MSHESYPFLYLLIFKSITTSGPINGQERRLIWNLKGTTLRIFYYSGVCRCDEWYCPRLYRLSWPLQRVYNCIILRCGSPVGFFSRTWLPTCDFKYSDYFQMVNVSKIICDKRLTKSSKSPELLILLRRSWIINL